MAGFEVILIMRLIIAGTRTFTDYPFLVKAVDHAIPLLFQKLLYLLPTIEVVSGKARGVDTLGELLAASRGWLVHAFPANWEKYGARAGNKRNKEMGKFADALVAVWNGKSPGTKNMIERMNLLGKPSRVYMYER